MIMKKIGKLAADLLFGVDFNMAIDDAFCDYAKMCGDEPGPVKNESLPEKIEIKKSHGHTYIYDTHATIMEI
jgi:hypothetical protein